LQTRTHAKNIVPQVTQHKQYKFNILLKTQKCSKKFKLISFTRCGTEKLEFSHREDEKAPNKKKTKNKNKL
jgi:hypothetical protein